MFKAACVYTQRFVWPILLADSQESEEKSVAKHRFFHNSHEIDKMSGLF